jgi:hypothetical protein
MPPLTKKRLRAVIEALTARLAGAIDTDIPREDYEQALLWAQAKLQDREWRR